MKASAALLAGLLAGLALGALDRAQPLPTLLSQARAQEDGFELEQPEEDSRQKNPLKGASRKTLKCIVGCQDPYQKCQKGCGKKDEPCVDACGKKLMSCTEGCGLDMDKLVPEEKGRAQQGRRR